MIRRVVPLLLLATAPAVPLAAQAPRTVTVGRPVTDSLSARDAVRRSARAPYQIWQLEGRRGQRLVVDLESGDFDAYLIVRDPDGYVVGSDDDSGDELNARLHAILARDGTYRIIATAVGDSARGQYTLSVRGWETPPAPAAGQAATLAFGDTKDGLLEPGDDVSADGGFQDRWTFAARPNARLRIELRSDDFDSYLTVTGPDGAVLGSDDDGLGERNSLVTLRARAAGTYTILVSSFGEDLRVGAYRVTVAEETGVFADPGEPAAIQVGETKQGRLESGDAVGDRGIQDRWTFQGRAGQVVRLDAVSSDFDPYLVLRFNETVVDSNDDGGDGNSARILATLPGTGTYTAVVSAYTEGGTGGRYSLALTASAAAAEPGRTARIAFGQRLAGRLERGDLTRQDGGPQDTWEFDGRADQDVTIELRSGAFDTYLELRDPQGNVVSENDDGLGDGTDSFVAAHLTRAGRYRIVVRGYGDRESTGLYELALAQASPSARPGQAIEVRPGETYMGRLEPGDSIMGDSSYADVCLFRPTVSGRVVIQVRSSDFDAYLMLQDAEGRTLASDDDGGSGTDAQLSYEVVAGRTYRILANSYGEERQTGAYRVTVRPAS
ncbi:MAG: PPC domain-containing protein [Gemmatimonadota bacterium]